MKRLLAPLMCLLMWTSDVQAACQAARTGIPTCNYLFFANYPTNVITPGCEDATCGSLPTSLTDDLYGAFWMLGMGDVRIGHGTDNGSWPVWDWLYIYPGYPAYILTNAWSRGQFLVDHCWGVAFGTSDCMTMLFNDRLPTAPGGAFAVATAHHAPTRFDFDFSQDGEIDLVPLPVPEIVQRTSEAAVVSLPSEFDTGAGGLYLDPECADEAPPLRGYRVFVDPAAPGEPPLDDPSIDAWAAASGVVPVGGTVEVPLVCTEERTLYLASSLVFDSGFETHYLSAPTLGIPCIRVRNAFTPLLDADFDDKAVDERIDLRGARFGEPVNALPFNTGAPYVRDGVFETASLEIGGGLYGRGSVGFRFIDDTLVSFGRLTISAELRFDRLIQASVRVQRVDQTGTFATLIFSSDGQMRVADADSPDVGIRTSFPRDRPFPVSLVFDLDTRTYDVYLDGCFRVLEDEPYGLTHDAIGALGFETRAEPDSDGRLNLDNVLVQRGENPYGLADVCDGIDNDCDGTFDEGELESCDNGIDDDCDGSVDGEDLADCETPTVLLESFTARYAGGVVLLEWRTAAETDNAGFRLWRRRQGGRLVEITPRSIPAAGTETTGASYRYVDDPGRLHGRVEYFLDDVNLLGVSTRHGPVSVLVPVAR